jgi:hypothetical protein
MAMDLDLVPTAATATATVTITTTITTAIMDMAAFPSRSGSERTRLEEKSRNN